MDILELWNRIDSSVNESIGFKAPTMVLWRFFAPITRVSCSDSNDQSPKYELQRTACDHLHLVVVQALQAIQWKACDLMLSAQSEIE